MIELVESDRPRDISEKISEFLARPPQPVLRFYGDFSTEVALFKRQIIFAVRNGLPLPLLYGIYVFARYDAFTEYGEKTDHIGPFSIDDWRLTIDTLGPVELEIRVGLVPFEILLDKAIVVV